MQVTFDPSQKPARNQKGRLVYKGVIPKQKEVSSEQKAYFIGNNCPDHIFYGIICAIVRYKDYSVFVIAEQHSSCYEPEIANSVCVCNDPKPEKIVCLYEKSCGGVVYKWENNRLMFLLIKNRHAWHWTFPKGHIEQGENEHQTAEREIFEETGLRVKVVNGFRQTCEYRPFGTVKKHVVLFLARSYAGQVKIQAEEVDRYAWVSFKTALKMFKHENDKRVLRRAKNWIAQNDKPVNVSSAGNNNNVNSSKQNNQQQQNKFNH